MMTHQMKIFSALLAICAGNSPVTGEFPEQRPVARSFDIFFDLCLNKRLSKQSWGWWFETLSRSLWCHCKEWRGFDSYTLIHFRFGYLAFMISILSTASPSHESVLGGLYTPAGNNGNKLPNSRRTDSIQLCRQRPAVHGCGRQRNWSLMPCGYSHHKMLWWEKKVYLTAM